MKRSSLFWKIDSENCEYLENFFRTLFVRVRLGFQRGGRNMGEKEKFSQNGGPNSNKGAPTRPCQT
jgi:hypothetical protein